MAIDVEASRMNATQNAHAPQDMGPLAWILDELRHALDAASRSVAQYAAQRAAQQTSGAAQANEALLRSAHHQLHQCGGALHMVGMSAPALILSGMEAAVLRCMNHPALCTPEAATTLEQASFALIEYLQTLLAGKNVSAVALFPQYRDTQALAGNDKTHPADLWPAERRLREPPWQRPPKDPLPYGPQARAQMDALVLRLIKGDDREAAADMRDLSLRLAAGCAEDDTVARRFWKVAAGFFDGQASGLIAGDVYVKRIASRTLMQYAAFARGGSSARPPARLLQDLLFFCAQAHPSEQADQAGSALAAVRQAHGMHRLPRANYHVTRFGRHTPSMQAQARKRVATAAATWSALTGGEKARIQQVQEQFALLAESLVKIHPGSHLLARMLIQVSDTVARIGQVPPAELGMEVATAILFLQSVFSGTDLGDEDMPQHAASLVQRLQLALQGESAGPLQYWMEELYRQSSDQQTLGSVVQELRINLDEVERHLDQYFRNPADISVLAPVSGKMAQMRGVLALLDIAHAVHAMEHMRDVVDQLVLGEIAEAQRRKTFEKLGTNLGAMGFLIDMLSYQRNMAKKLFVWDEDKGELRMFSTRQRSRRADDDANQDALPPLPIAQEGSATVAPPREVLGVQQPSESPPPAENAWPALVRKEDLPTLHPTESSFGPSTFGPASGFGPQEDASTTAQPGAALGLAKPLPDLSPEAETEAETEAAQLDTSDTSPEQPPEPEPTAEADFALSLPDLPPEAETEAAQADTSATSPEQPPEPTAEADFALSLPDLLPEVETEATQADTSATSPEQPSEPAAEADFAPSQPDLPSEAETEATQVDTSDAASQPPPEALPELPPEAKAQADASATPPLQPSELEAGAAPPTLSLNFPASPLPLDEPAAAPPPAPVTPAFAPVPAPAAPAAAPGGGAHEVTDELLPVFLEEAREVVENGQQALRTLAETPDDYAEQTTLRRALHTLKGSSRMVGLGEFGEAAWAMEQMLNAWLAEHQPMPEAMQSLASEALAAFAAWAQALEQGQAQGWQSAPFRAAADAMRLHGERIALAVAGVAAAPPPPPAAPARQSTPAPPPASPQPVPVPAPPPPQITELDALPTLPTRNDPLADTPQPTTPLPDLGLPPLADSPGAQAAAAPEEAPHLPTLIDVAPAAPVDAENSKTAGHLRIDRALYDVFVDEAGQWLAQLDAALHQWQSTPREAPPAQADGHAHALAGSSAALGFDTFSHLARLLEHALAHLQLQGWATPEQITTCLNASDALHHLLHQFTGGVLGHAPEAVTQALQAICAQSVHEESAPPSAAHASGGAVDATPQQAAAPQQPTPPAAPEATPDVPEAIPVLTPAQASAPAPATPGDQVDPDLFPIFEEEALELLPRLGAALRRWSERPAQADAREAALRALHTLKGSARLAGAMHLGEMAHQMETQAAQVDAQGQASGADIEPLLTSLDALQERFDALRIAYDEQLEELPLPPSQQQQAAASAPAPQEPPPQEPPAAAAPPAAPVPTAAPPASPVPAARHTPPPATPKPVQTAAPRAAQHSVRVRAQLLDNLIGEAGEILIARSRINARLVRARAALGDLTGNLERLRTHLRDVEIQSESQMQSRMAQAQFPQEGEADFDPLEFDRFTRVQELTRMMAESVNDVATVQHNLQRDLAAAEDELARQARQTRQLQTDLLHTRMVEFDSLTERLHALVRQVGRELGKHARLNISGGGIEMDRSVLERMMPVFEHLLRNCLAHGIEPPAQRRAAGKHETGVIDIILEQDGNDVALTVQDDGKGLDLERIRQKAVEKGLWRADKPLDAQEAGQLIFASGLTTSSKVTGVSGRGVGMDVVRTEVTALGGHVHTRSEAGKGSAFRMVLPLTTAVSQVVMVRAGPFIVGVPVNLVEMVRRAPLEQLEQAYRDQRFEESGQALPFYWSGALLQTSRRSDETVDRPRPVLIVRSAAQRIALHVDEVLGNQEVVVKNLGPQLARLPGLTGMSVLPSGALVQIYNPVALANVYGDAVRALQDTTQEAAHQEDAQKAAAIAAPLILVVDDSITVRRVTQRILQREGYRVQLANDGLQALDCLQQERPALVLSDIEMPRMDGFDLLRNIRAEPDLAELPVIMITSRIAQKHRDMAQQLGANHYLGKPYTDDALLDLIRHYTLLEDSAQTD